MNKLEVLYSMVVCPSCANKARRMDYNQYADATLGRCPNCKVEVEI